MESAIVLGVIVAFTLIVYFQLIVFLIPFIGVLGYLLEII